MQVSVGPTSNYYQGSLMTEQDAAMSAKVESSVRESFERMQRGEYLASRF